MRIGIVGGGIIGTSIAYFLAKQGADDIVLFEKNNIGSGSTGKSTGVVRHHYSDEIQVRVSKRGSDILASLEDELGNDGGFHQNGYLILAGEENEEQFRHNIAIQERVGVDVGLVHPDELTEYVPQIDPDGVSVAAIEHDGGFADPYQVAVAFSQAAQDRGVTIKTNTPVVDVGVDNGTVTGVETPSDHYDIDYLVNAAGPAGDEIAEMIGFDVPLTRYEAKEVVLTASESYELEKPTVSDIDIGLYTKPEPSGDFVAGGVQRQSGLNELSDSEGLEGVTNEELRILGDMLDTRLPGYSDVRVVNTWSGVITASPDWHQIVGVPNGYENVYNILAHGGHGFKEAPAFAESAAQTILGKEPRLDFSPYRLERFVEDEPFTLGYEDGSRA